MALHGYIPTLLNSLDQNTRRVLTLCFDYVQNNWRLGNAPRAAYAQWYFFRTVTPAVANTEFVITHNLGVSPTFLPISAVDLGDSNSQTVLLKCARPADPANLYLQSPTTSASIAIWVEV